MKPILYINLLFILLSSFSASAQGVWIQKADYLGSRRFDFTGYALNGKGNIGSRTYGGINSF